jgi:hypothetical protein
MKNLGARVPLLLAVFALCAGTAVAGGPMLVGSPANGIDGQSFVWNPAAMPVRYRVDAGPMSAIGFEEVISNGEGVQRVQAMFQTWQNVPTTSIAFSYAGGILPTGAFSGGDVATVTQFNAVMGSCDAAQQNPIIFDASGSIFAGLGLDPAVIGFAGVCAIDAAHGYILSGGAALNGAFQDGQAGNYELTAAQFDEAITHELGHFAGLDHSQINVNVLNTSGNCALDELAGLPLMFPILRCQARSSAGLPTLAPDDVAWISRLYPAASFATSYRHHQRIRAVQ